MGGEGSASRHRALHKIENTGRLASLTRLGSPGLRVHKDWGYPERIKGSCKGCEALRGPKGTHRMWGLTSLRIPGRSGDSARAGGGTGRPPPGTLTEFGALAEPGSADRTGVSQDLKAPEPRIPSCLRGWASKPSGRRSPQNAHSGPGDPD